MPTIDLRSHAILPAAFERMAAAHPVHAPVLYDENEKKFINYPGRHRLGPLPKGILDPERRTADMDRQRVDIQVITVPSSQFYYHTPPEVAVDFVRLQNDALMELSDSMPERLHVFAILPLQDVGAAIEEVVRVAEHPRVRGVTVGTNVNGLYFHEPIFNPLWDELDRYNLPVWIQPDQRSVAGVDRLNVFYFENFLGNPIDSTIACASLIFGGVVERHPALRFGFVHGGGFAPYQIGRWDHGWSVREEARRFIPDKPPRDYLRLMYFDSLTHDTDSLDLLGRRVGWDHVVLGSDYPFDMASSDPVGDVDKLGLEESERAAVLGDNAERFLRPIGGKS